MPEHKDRRTFLKESVVAASALAIGCDRGPGGARAGSGPDAGPLPGDALGALAEVVLPSEIGPDGRRRAVDGFRTWLAGYAPVTEQVHGYGSAEIQYGPEDPAPRWTAQLEALDREARARHGSDFAGAVADERRAIVEAALEDETGGIASRPGALEAGHVATGLLAFFYGGPDATDLCYRRAIGGTRCRPLAASGDVPPPLDTDGSTAPTASAPDVRRLVRRTGGGRIEPGLEPAS